MNVIQPIQILCTARNRMSAPAVTLTCKVAYTIMLTPHTVLSVTQPIRLLRVCRQAASCQHLSQAKRNSHRSSGCHRWLSRRYSPSRATFKHLASRGQVVAQALHQTHRSKIAVPLSLQAPAMTAALLSQLPGIVMSQMVPIFLLLLHWSRIGHQEQSRGRGKAGSGGMRGLGRGCSCSRWGRCQTSGEECTQLVMLLCSRCACNASLQRYPGFIESHKETPPTHTFFCSFFCLHFVFMLGLY